MFTDWKKKKIQLTDFHSLVELIADRLFDTHVNDFLDSFYFWCMRALQHYFACHYMKNWVRFLLFIYHYKVVISRAVSNPRVCREYGKFGRYTMKQLW